MPFTQMTIELIGTTPDKGKAVEITCHDGGITVFTGTVVLETIEFVDTPAEAAQKERRKEHQARRGKGKRRQPKLRHMVIFPYRERTRPLTKWCAVNCQAGWTAAPGSTRPHDMDWKETAFAFKDEEDALMFQIMVGGRYYYIEDSTDE